MRPVRRDGRAGAPATSGMGPRGGAGARPVRALGRRPGLDAVRGAAWAGVFGAHAGLFPVPGLGESSMFVFFVLSGFLITELLIEEQRRFNAVSLRRFFGRRALRLLPALGAFLAVWLVVVLVFGSSPWITTVPGGGSGGGIRLGVALEGVVAAATYLTNWATILHGFTGYVPIGHLWSLAIEEQLYLVWAPLVALVLLRLPGRLSSPIALVLAVGSTVEVGLVSAASDRVYMGTDTRSGAFLLGGAIAFSWSRGAFRWIRPGRSWPGVAVAAAVLAWCAPELAHPTGVRATVVAWSLSTLSSGLLVLMAVEASPHALAGVIGRCITYVGRRSYALYLWHYVWLTWLRSLGVLGVGIALVATLSCAEASWRLVERPALRRRDRLRSESTPAPAEPPVGVEQPALSAAS